ncbi:MAG TPA: nucleotidyltransferase family protein [Actinomycetota bacterium]|nr:nucleotidyltransferase family protein [Actinomycetota bacterium]
MLSSISPSDAVRQATRSLALDVAAVEAIEALSAAGIQSVLLKGRSIADWLYDDGTPRPYVDIDLLVDPGVEARAQDVLLNLGYGKNARDTIPFDRPPHCTLWVRGVGHTALELHTTLVGVGAPRESVWRTLSSHKETLHVAGRPLPVLSPAAIAFQIALHAAQHGPTSPKALEDLNRALKRVDFEGWRIAASIAEGLDAIPAFGVGLRLDGEGVELADELGLPSRPTVELIIRSRGHSRGALALDWLDARPGVAFKARFLLRKIASPRRFIRDWDPRATRGPGALALAYVRRWIWLARETPGAIRDLRRAKREARWNP